MKAKLNESLGIPAGKQKLQYEVKWGQTSEVLNFSKFKKKILNMVNFDIYFLSIICERFNNIVKILYRGKLFLCWNLLWL